MSVRFIVRPPQIKRTPKRLAGLLSARRTAPAIGPTAFDWSQDLFLAYPPPHKVSNADEAYLKAHQFYCAHKRDQRGLLTQSDVSVVPTFMGGGPLINSDQVSGADAPRDGYIIRPLRHSAGQSYQFTTLAPIINPYTHYVSMAIKKTKEFRVIYYRGKKLTTYLKTNPNNISYEHPWNFSNGCVFNTITRPENDILQHIGFYSQLDNCPYITSPHIVAVDILYDGNANKAYVCEANLCPGISIRATLNKILEVETNDRI